MTRRIVIAAALLALLFTVGWYEGLYRSEANHIKALNAKEQTAAASLLALQDRYISLVASEKRLPAEEVALAKLRGLVPDGPDLDNIVTTLFQAAASSGTQLDSIGSPEPQSFQTGTPGSTSGLATVAPGPAQLVLSLSVTGTPGEIKQLYKVLDAEPRLFVIDTFSIPVGTAAVSGLLAKGARGPVSAPGAIEASITLRAFYAVPNATNAAS